MDMKIKQLLLAGVASMMVFSCTDKDDASVIQDEIKAVSVSLSGINTRASAPTGIITKDTMNVNSVLINLTDVNDQVIATRTVAKDNVTDSPWDRLTDPAKGLKFVNIPQSVSKVYIYGNPKNYVTNNVAKTNLIDQQGSEVLYYGVDTDLQPIVNEPISPTPTLGQTYTAQVTITPVVARLQVTSLTIKDSGSFKFTRTIDGAQREATVNWSGFTANLKGIYLNNIYNTYNNPGTLETLLLNSTYVDYIREGMWIFPVGTPVPNIDAASFGSYNAYDATSATYGNLPYGDAINGKCYAFNFFPGTAVPQLHFDLSDIVITGLTSTDEEVYNPAVAQGGRFVNVIKFYKDVINTPMTAADFVPGTLYNMAIELVPILDTDLGNVQYNVMVHVTIAPWNEQTIYPGYDDNL